MHNPFKKATLLLTIGGIIGLSACESSPGEANVSQVKQLDTITNNPVMYFEIPVKRMDTAIQFYQQVFDFQFTQEVIDHHEMALFPFYDRAAGISGALAKGGIYEPSKTGVLIYFGTKNIHKTMERALKHGGKMLYPITDNGLGLVAEFQDIEGNRIALFQKK